MTSNDNNDDAEQWLDVLCTRTDSVCRKICRSVCCCRCRGCCTHWKIINKLDKLQHLINYVFCVRFSTCYVCESIDRFDVHRNCFHLYCRSPQLSSFPLSHAEIASISTGEIDVDFLIHINSCRRRDALSLHQFCTNQNSVSFTLCEMAKIKFSVKNGNYGHSFSVATIAACLPCI